MNSRTVITAVTAFAITSSAFAYRAPSASYRAQPLVVDNRGMVGNNTGYGTSDRDLKQAIHAKRKQARQFRKAGDPRAAQAEQELRILQDRQRQWHQNDRNADDRNLKQRNERDDDREGDRVHGNQKKSEKNHGKKNDEHDDEDDQDR